MSVDPKLLEELRVVFLEEVAVQRAALADVLVVLERETSDPVAVRDAAAEAFRIAHALKGAARAVGDDGLVALAHGVEDALIAVRRGETVPRDVAIAGVSTLLDGLPGQSPDPAREQRDAAPEADVVVPVSSQELREMRDEARELRAILFLTDPAEASVAESRLARERAIERARRLSQGLQRLYAQPVDDVAPQLERNALEVAKVSGKRVRFSVEGGSLRFDRGLLQRVVEALMHLVANAVDHGIEPSSVREAAGKPAFGRVTLTVGHDGSDAVFSVEDDGAGLDQEALHAKAPHADRPAFEPGVSTSSSASTVSGRGMGLDFVRRCAAELGGEVQLGSRPGQGTTVSLSVPMAEGGLTAVLVQLEGTTYGLPLGAVERIVRLSSDALEHDDDGFHFELDGRRLQAGRLERVLRGEDAPNRLEARCVGVVLRSDPPWFLLVPRVLRQANIIVRPLGGRLRGLPLVSGTFRQPSGAVGVVLDPKALLRALRAGRASEGPLETMAAASRVLVVDDSVTTRQLVRLVLESGGFAVDTAADGDAAWARLRDGRYVAVVSDLEMPRLDGFALLERCRGDDVLRDLPFIVLTGRDEGEARARCEKLGVEAFVEKGTFETDELLSTVAAVAERRG